MKTGHRRLPQTLCLNLRAGTSPARSDTPQVRNDPEVTVTDDDLRKYGYAPGDYCGPCRACGETMWNIAKRAPHCRECAEKMAVAANAASDANALCSRMIEQ